MFVKANQTHTYTVQKEISFQNIWQYVKMHRNVVLDKYKKKKKIRH